MSQHTVAIWSASGTGWFLTCKLWWN